MKLLALLLLLGFAVSRSDTSSSLRVQAWNGGTKIFNSCTSNVERLKDAPPDYAQIS